LIGAIVIAVAAIAVAVGGVPAPGVDSVGYGASFDAAISSGSGLIVEVAGAVARPGVYHLAPGARVGDAVAAAGGFGPRVDARRAATDLNLAALVRDGERVVVPSRDDAPSATGDGGSAGSGGSGSTAGPGLVDLNHATADELEALPGIGPVTADKIVASRAEAPFRSVDELHTRGLVGQKTFDKLRSLVTVG
jgi:competence protein ComEA